MKKTFKTYILNKLLTEEINSVNDVIVYHRTGKNLIDKELKHPNLKTLPQRIALSGLRKGETNSYGDGIYCTYEIESQLNPRMIKMYGNIIMKLKVKDISKFLIFDEQPAKIVYGNNYHPNDQLKQLGQYEKVKSNRLKELLANFDFKLYDDSSSLFAGYIQTLWIKYVDIDGIMFTGQSDGKVLVIFNTELIEYESYSIDNAQTWIELNKNKLSSKKQNLYNYNSKQKIEKAINIIKEKLENTQHSVDDYYIKKDLIVISIKKDGSFSTVCQVVMDLITNEYSVYLSVDDFNRYNIAIVEISKENFKKTL